MSLTQLVTDLIQDHGQQTVESILPLLAGEHVTCTRYQVATALANAKFNGKLVVVGKGPRMGKVPGMSIYALAPAVVVDDEDKPLNPVPRFTKDCRPVSSVWELGSRACL
jgi:hypothetical protein